VLIVMRILFPTNLRAELRANLALALPLLAAQLLFISMGTVDTIVAGRLGAAPLAAVAVGSNLWFMMFVLFWGLFMAVSPIVAQRLGARRLAAESGAFLRGALTLAALLGLAWLAVLLVLIDPMLELLQLEPQTRGFAEDYLRAIAPGALPFALFFALRNAAEGYGQTRATLWAGMVGFAVNGLLAYGLANGAWGLPALGARGCGIATAIAGASMVLAFAALYRWHPRLRELQLYGRTGWGPGPAAAEILRLGAPISLIVTAEAWLFLIGALLMARFGTDVVAAHQIAINFASVTFMVPMSIGMATTVRVGYAAGAGDAAGVRLRGLAGIGMGAGFSLVSASVMALLPGAIVAAYTDAAGVAPLAVGFLYYAAVFQIADCVQATANGALRGVKDARIPMLITVSAYWLVGLPLAVVLSFHTAAGPAGVWLGFIAGLVVAAAGLGARFLRRTQPPAPAAA
jgi:multidrug resistance protein, MATE family